MRVPKYLGPAIVLVLMAPLSCGTRTNGQIGSASATATSPSPSPMPSPEPTPGSPVTFRTADGVRIAGRLFGRGRIGVVLGHSIDGDQTEWWDFAELLADRGYTALSIDFRGYCPRDGAGCSGEGTTGDAWRDMAGGAAYLRGHDIGRVVLIGASMGGTAAIVAAGHGAPGLAGVVTLSAPTECCGMVADPVLLGAIGVPELFIAGRFDGDAPMSVHALARWAGPGSDAMILTSGEHGTDLLGGLATPQVERRTTEAVLDFLEGIRHG